MSENDTETDTTQGKKRKIIRWSPETDNADTAQEKGLSKPLVTMLVLLFLITTGLFLFGPFKDSPNEAPVDSKEVQVKSSEDVKGEERTLEELSDNKYRFVSKEQLELRREHVKQELDAVRKLTDEHPSLIENLVRIEKSFDESEKEISGGNFPLAMARMEKTEDLIDAYKVILDAKRKASEAYDAFASLINERLYVEKVKPVEYQKITNVAGEGGDLMKAGKFAEAEEKLRTAHGMLTKVAAGVDAMLAEKEALGTRALAKGNQEQAVQVFQEILDIQPTNKAVKQKLKRAEVLNKVFPLLASAATKEESGQLEAALADFDAAFQLDSRSANAQKGKYRVQAAIKTRDFTRTMSEAKQLEKEGKWEEALKRYETARKIDPGKRDKEIDQAIAENRKMQAQDRVKRGLAHARRLESEYKWIEAREAYNAVLTLDPNNKEAKEGLIYTGKIGRGLMRYEQYIKDAKTFAARGEFQKGLEAYQEAMANKPSYLFKDSKLLELEALLKAQTKPVQVTFVSDNKTYITIKGHKSLGYLKEETITMMPGNYTIRGARTKYRDTNIPLRIRYGSYLGPVQVICTQRAN